MKRALLIGLAAWASLTMSASAMPIASSDALVVDQGFLVLAKGDQSGRGPGAGGQKGQKKGGHKGKQKEGKDNPDKEKK